jgi:hypothetical protein
MGLYVRSLIAVSVLATCICSMVSQSKPYSRKGVTHKSPLVAFSLPEDSAAHRKRKKPRILRAGLELRGRKIREFPPRLLELTQNVAFGSVTRAARA